MNIVRTHCGWCALDFGTSWTWLESQPTLLFPWISASQPVGPTPRNSKLPLLIPKSLGIMSIQFLYIVWFSQSSFANGIRRGSASQGLAANTSTTIPPYTFGAKPRKLLGERSSLTFTGGEAPTSILKGCYVMFRNKVRIGDA